MYREYLRIPYAAGTDYQVVQLPYVGETVDMLIIRPEPERFAAVAARLSVD